MSTMATDTNTVALCCARSVTDYFKKNPFRPYQLKPFTSTKGLLGPLLKDLEVPIPINPMEHDKEFPSLLLHDLENAKHRDRAVYKYIDKSRNFCRGLYGTSGAGKTRSVYEYLSHNFGFYFLAKNSKDPGSSDLLKVIEWFALNNTVLPEENPRFDDESQETPKAKKKRQESARQIKSEQNHLAMDKYIMVMIYVRILIFNSINDQLKEQKLDALTPYDWLLIQLFPKETMGRDLFSKVTFLGLVKAKDLPLDTTVMSGLVKSCEGEDGWRWSVMVVDEAQDLLHRLLDYFLDKKGEAWRTVLSAVLKSMAKLVYVHLDEKNTGAPLVAGTRMSRTSIKEVAESVTAKNPQDLGLKIVFKSFELLSAGAVRTYLLSFLKVDLEVKQEGSASNDMVVDHVAKWLRGRPRWAASFVELYLYQKFREYEGTRGSFLDDGRILIQALDRYIANYTTAEITDGDDQSGCNRRKSYDPPEGTAFSAIREASDRGGVELVKILEHAIFKYAVTGKEVLIEEEIGELVEQGVAALRVDNTSTSKAVIDEPLIVQAGLNFYSLADSALKNMIGQEAGGQGEAFEKVVLPAIQNRFKDILTKQLGKSGDILKDYMLPYKSAYGVLGFSCETIEETLQWIADATGATFEGQVPPFCYPDTNIGPDLMFLLWNMAFTEYFAVIAQAKYKKDKNLNQREALQTITPSLLYHELRGKKEQRPSRQLNKFDRKTRWEALKKKLVREDSDEHGCVRFVVQYPCKHTKSAKPGLLEDDEVVVGEKEKKNARAGDEEAVEAEPKGEKAKKSAKKSAKKKRKRAARSPKDKEAMQAESKKQKKKTTDDDNLTEAKKLGFLTCISETNAEDLFDGRGLKVFTALKQAPLVAARAGAGPGTRTCNTGALGNPRAGALGNPHGFDD